ncbi:MAG: LytTR family transcriptional regulator DNA-binding domain-containing protein [Chloroflexota bacterium]
MITIHNLQKVIDGRTLLDIPELRVGAGQLVSLVGPAGSGKDILLDLLTGRTRPTSGEVRLAGLLPWSERLALSRQVGVLFPENGLYQQHTCLANLSFYCRLYGLPDGRAETVLAQVGLADHASVRASKLASGLARRLAFGRALIHAPQALVLAEPFNQCDEASIAFISQLMRDQAAQGVAQLVLASDVTYLQNLSDALYLLEGGRLAEAYPSQEFARPGAPFKVPVRFEDKVILVNPADILYADAEGGRADLHTLEGRLSTQFTLTELEERLARSGFFRAHRAYLVNLQHVKEVIPYTRNSFSLRLDDPASTEIPLSKSAASELKDLLGY